MMGKGAVLKRHWRHSLVFGIAFLLTWTTPGFAFGPYVHQNAMRKTNDTLFSQYSEVPILWSTGSPWDNIEADLNGPSHGCDVNLDAGLLNGNLSGLVETQYTRVRSGYIRFLEGDASVDLSKDVRRLCHYVADGMAIGQISGPSLWGWKDDLIDLASESVSDKRQWQSGVMDWEEGGFEQGLAEFETSVLDTYETYRQDADKWFREFPWFPTARDVTHMTRRGVSQAATLTSSFIRLAWVQATDACDDLANPGFEKGLDFWHGYGDGFVEFTSEDAYNGSYSAHLERDDATGQYFGLCEKEVVVEPDTEYRLSLWIKTRVTSGFAAAGFGVWSSDPMLNHHTDFGHTDGMTDWTLITGTWTSRPDEYTIKIVLYGTPDFAGEAFFDDLVLEEVEPQ